MSRNFLGIGSKATKGAEGPSGNTLEIQKTALWEIKTCKVRQSNNREEATCRTRQTEGQVNCTCPATTDFVFSTPSKKAATNSQRAFNWQDPNSPEVQCLGRSVLGPCSQQGRASLPLLAALESVHHPLRRPAAACAPDVACACNKAASDVISLTRFCKCPHRTSNSRLWRQSGNATAVPAGEVASLCKLQPALSLTLRSLLVASHSESSGRQGGRWFGSSRGRGICPGMHAQGPIFSEAAAQACQVSHLHQTARTHVYKKDSADMPI